MKNKHKKAEPTKIKKTGKDNKAYKSGSDVSSDKTLNEGHDDKKPTKFDKPSRETDPDKTGIDTNADATIPATNEASKNQHETNVVGN